MSPEPTAPPVASPIGPGRILDGRYRVERSLGSGGMGEVLLAHDMRMDKAVVVKVPHARFLADEGFRSRFEKEVRSLTRLEHLHVVKALDVGTVRGVPFVVLQHLAGGNLKDRLQERGGSLTPSEISVWLEGIAEALDFIHGEGVVHRDVKPANILFDKAGNVFLGDFGIAKALTTGDTGVTSTGVTPGSPDYMAPEIAAGGRLLLAYDQYALGVVVYEALSGRLPHQGASPIAMLVAKVESPPVPLAIAAPSVPPGVAAAVMQAISRDPARRFHRCSDFAAAFERGLADPAPRGGPRPHGATASRAAPEPAARPGAERPRRPAVSGPAHASPPAPPASRIDGGPEAAGPHEEPARSTLHELAPYAVFVLLLAILALVWFGLPGAGGG